MFIFELEHEGLVIFLWGGLWFFGFVGFHFVGFDA